MNNQSTIYINLDINSSVISWHLALLEEKGIHIVVANRKTGEISVCGVGEEA